MKNIHPQYITTDKGKKISVVIPIKEYLIMLEELEEIEDVRMYDQVKANKEESIPFNDYLKKRKKRKNA
jgi:hypothetical protein